jgi:hypothetical protein
MLDHAFHGPVDLSRIERPAHTLPMTGWVVQWAAFRTGKLRSF